MRVFIGMETSGELRRRFMAQGHQVISCDLLPAEDEGENHIVGDVFATLDRLRDKYGWWPDLAIFHPTCTYLTNSAAWAFNDPDYERYPDRGGYHQRVKPETLTGAARRAAREEALNDVRRIMALPIRRKAIENPIGAIGTRIRKPDQIVQPYEFGDDASKATCLWFCDENGYPLPEMALPKDPNKRVPGRIVAGRERWSNQTDSGQNRLSPGEDRWKDRSRTFPGIADAMVEKWGLLSISKPPQKDLLSGLTGVYTCL